MCRWLTANQRKIDNCSWYEHCYYSQLIMPWKDEIWNYHSAEYQHAIMRQIYHDYLEYGITHGIEFDIKDTERLNSYEDFCFTYEETCQFAIKDLPR